MTIRPKKKKSPPLADKDQQAAGYISSKNA